MTTKKKTTKKKAAPKKNEVANLRESLRMVRKLCSEQDDTIKVKNDLLVAKDRKIHELTEKLGAADATIAKLEQARVKLEADVQTAVTQRDEAYQRGLDVGKGNVVQTLQTPPVPPNTAA